MKGLSKGRYDETFSGEDARDLTITHLDLSHFALCIMGN